MNTERFVGLVFSISVLLILLFFVLTPQVDYQQKFKILDSMSKEEAVSVNEIEENPADIIKEESIKPSKK